MMLKAVMRSTYFRKAVKMSGAMRKGKEVNEQTRKEEPLRRATMAVTYAALQNHMIRSVKTLS